MEKEIRVGNTVYLLNLGRCETFLVGVWYYALLVKFGTKLLTLSSKLLVLTLGYAACGSIRIVKSTSLAVRTLRSIYLS